MDSSTGAVTVKADIDFETYDNFTFVVIGTDRGSPTLSGTATVSVSVDDINDNAPVFV